MASIQVIHISDNPRPSRTIRIGKPSLAEAASDRGIDAQRAIRNLKQRARYHQHLDRPKHWAGDPCPSNYFFRSNVEQKHVDAAQAALNAATDTASYAKAWALLNHLKEC